MSIGGDNLQFYTNFSLFSTLGVMKFDHDCFHVSKLSEDPPKKRSSPEIEEYLSPTSLEDQGPNIIQRSDADHSPIIGGMQM